MFWTTVVPANSVHVASNLDSASIEVADLAQKDYIDLENALFGGGPVFPGRVSFRVEWTATGPLQHVENAQQTYRADVRAADAKMEWSAHTVEYTFQSAPLASSNSDAGGAELADEANGSYF